MIAAQLAAGASQLSGDDQNRLAVGVVGHAFDHLGNIADEAEATAASGANIIYASGFGSLGYGGLPAPAEYSLPVPRSCVSAKPARVAFRRASSARSDQTVSRNQPVSSSRHSTSQPASSNALK